MQVTVIGRHMVVTDPPREYAEEKFGRVSKIFDADPIVAEVVLNVGKNRSRPGRFTRRRHPQGSRATSVGPRRPQRTCTAASIWRRTRSRLQMRKYKTKVIDRRNHVSRSRRRPPGDDADLEEPAEPPSRRSLGFKTLEVMPMTDEEAILQLELLGHDFFVFRHADTEPINVLYRRNDGDFGLIQPPV